MLKKSVYLLILCAFLISQVFSSSFESPQGCGRYGELCDVFRTLNSPGDQGRKGYGTFGNYDRQEYPSKSASSQRDRVLLVDILYTYLPIFKKILFEYKTFY